MKKWELKLHRRFGLVGNGTVFLFDRERIIDFIRKHLMEIVKEESEVK